MSPREGLAIFVHLSDGSAVFGETPVHTVDCLVLRVPLVQRRGTVGPGCCPVQLPHVKGIACDTVVFGVSRRHSSLLVFGLHHALL